MTEQHAEFPQVSDTFRGLRYGALPWGGGEGLGDLARLTVPLTGAVEETGDRWMPFRLIGPDGAGVGVLR